MAGIGIKLNRIFRQRTLTARLYGFAYGAMASVAPMFAVIGAVIASQTLLNYTSMDYVRRALFSGTVLYMFVFSMIAASPFSAGAARRLADVLFLKRNEEVMPCFHVGLALTMGCGCALAASFCLREWLAGGVPLHYVFAGFTAFCALLAAAHAVPYLAAGEEYGLIALCHGAGMGLMALAAWALHRGLGWELTLSLLTAMAAGFLVTASLEIALIESYFPRSSGRCREALSALWAHRRPMLASLLYTLGLYAHNFVFWGSKERSVLLGCFATMSAYDMATYLALLTNISAPVILMARMEMRFHDRVTTYADAVRTGRARDIRAAQKALFRQLDRELGFLAAAQCAVTAVIFLAMQAALPLMGFGGAVARIYPCLCAGCYMLFLLYAALQFLTCLEDHMGALMAAAVFCLVTLAGSLVACRLPESWYGLGLTLGALAGFTAGYIRLHWLAPRLSVELFCRGALAARGRGKAPSAQVFAKDADK